MADETPRITRIGDVVAKLVAIADDVLDDVDVLDGPYTGQLSDRVLIVGLPDGGDAGYTTELTRQRGFGAVRYIEDWTVRCLLTVNTGSTTVAGIRDEVMGMMSDLDNALRDQVRVEDVWETADLAGEMQWFPIVGPDGAAFTVLFGARGRSNL